MKKDETFRFPTSLRIVMTCTVGVAVTMLAFTCLKKWQETAERVQKQREEEDQRRNERNERYEELYNRPPADSDHIYGKERLPPSVLQLSYDKWEKHIVVVGKQINLKAAKTIGGHSYVPLNIEGAPSTHHELILVVLKKFKEGRPELQITNWKIEKNQEAYRLEPFIFGLWIDHRPRKQETRP